MELDLKPAPAKRTRKKWYPDEISTLVEFVKKESLTKNVIVTDDMYPLAGILGRTSAALYTKALNEGWLPQCPEPKKGRHGEGWKERSAKIHAEYVRRAQTKGKLVTDDEVGNFLVLALAGEAGELANLFKKIWRGDSDSVSVGQIRDEIADIRIYLEHVANHLGINMDHACEKKISIVERRLEE